MVLLPKLIHHAKADVVFGYAERLRFGRGYRIHLRRPEPGMLSDDIELACGAMNATVEAMARENFLQYIWSYKRFALRPDGSFFEYGEDGKPFSEEGHGTAT
jgi:KDO2-lipid IV(A) lauroyltransferase